MTHREVRLYYSWCQLMGLIAVYFSLDELTHIGPGGQYDPPSRADGDSCLCSSVVYELVSACADCQGGAFSS